MNDPKTLSAERGADSVPRPCWAFRGRGLKLHNSYASAVPGYADTPKAVFAALAYSLALRLTGNEDHAAALGILHAEWAALHLAEIVPQHPPNDRGER